jgi:hypothetical protein
MSYDNTKKKGDMAELTALVYFANLGFTVSTPFGENAPYDIIVEASNKKLYRVQVRYCSWKNNALNLSLRMVSKNYNKTLDRSRIDIFFLWDGFTAYIVPVEETMTCKATFTMRKTVPRNGQTQGIRFASDYIDNTKVFDSM